MASWLACCLYLFLKERTPLRCSKRRGEVLVDFMACPEVPECLEGGPLSEEDRLHGFRVSVSDVLFIVGASVLFVAAGDQLGAMRFAIPVAVGHFFLFCNVFRIRRSYELFWTVVFLTNVGVQNFWLGVDWTWVLSIQLPLTLLLLVLEIRSERYHGILAERWNPKLPEYLAARLEATAD
jgi:hypothetical protein